MRFNDIPVVSTSNTADTTTGIQGLVVISNGDTSKEEFVFGADNAVPVDGVFATDERLNLTDLVVTATVTKLFPKAGMTESDYAAVALLVGDEDSLIDTTQEIADYANGLIPSADTPVAQTIMITDATQGEGYYHIDTSAAPFNDTVFYGLPRMYSVRVRISDASTTTDPESYIAFEDIIAVRF